MRVSPSTCTPPPPPPPPPPHPHNLGYNNDTIVIYYLQLSAVQKIKGIGQTDNNRTSQKKIPQE